MIGAPAREKPGSVYAKVDGSGLAALVFSVSVSSPGAACQPQFPKLLSVIGTFIPSI